MGTVLQDLRYAVRTLARNSGFTTIAILTLALGIGANSAIFSVVNTVLLRPLPYREPGRLMAIWERNSAIGKDRDPVAPLNLLDWRTADTGFEEIAGFRYASFALTNVESPEQLTALAVTSNFFRTLGVQPLHGRTFTLEEEKQRQPVVLISHRLWQKRFAGEPAISGKAISLSERSFTVLGVMAPDFRFPENETEVDLWSPLVFSRADLNSRSVHSLLVFGRLGAGITPSQASQKLQAIARRVAEKDPASNPEVTIVAAHDQLVENVRLGLIVLSGSVGFVLLIACANVANLLLVRSTFRRREIAIRASLGASRSRVARLLLTENLVLAGAGGGVGVLLTWSMVNLTVRFTPDSIPRMQGVTLDWTVVLFLTALSIVSGLLFGLVPALQASKSDLSAALKAGSRQASSSVARNRGLSVLVVAELSLSLTALAGAGLMIHSLLKLQALDYGFRPQGLLAAQIFLPNSKYPTDPTQFRALRPDEARPGLSPQSRFYDDLMRRLKALPGVEWAAAVSSLPLDEVGIDYDLPVIIRGRPRSRAGEEPQADFRIATMDYFRTMGIPVLRGRGFTEFDGPAASEVLVVNDTMARQFFPDTDPIGQHIQLYGRAREIVGIVGSVRHRGYRQEPRPEMIVPSNQFQLGGMTVVVRSSLDREALANSIKREVVAIDPNQPVYRFQSMDDKLSDSVAQPRFTTLLLTFFASLAVVLAVIGTYGVVSYAVAQRSHEIGVRIALGAEGSHVVGMVLRQGLGLVSAGVALGLAGATAMTRLMQGLLFGISATDPVTFFAVAALLMLSAMAAIYIPARRASRVDPMMALRSE